LEALEGFQLGMLKITSRRQFSKAVMSIATAIAIGGSRESSYCNWWVEGVYQAFEYFFMTLDQLLKVCLWYCLTD